MAILELDGDEVTSPNGESIIDGCEELGISFGCQSGKCGTCLTTIKEGMEYLSELTEEEEDFELEEGQRLLCQCKALEGRIVFEV